MKAVALRMLTLVCPRKDPAKILLRFFWGGTRGRKVGGGGVGSHDTHLV